MTHKAFPEEKLTGRDSEALVVKGQASALGEMFFFFLEAPPDTPISAQE